jgi:TonB family protein
MAARAQTPVEEPDPVPPARPEPVVPDRSRIYTIHEPGLTPAQPVRQEVPRPPPQILAGALSPTGLLEIVISETGQIEDVRLRASIHPFYDNMLIAAARKWQYRPATVAGTPVKFRRLVQISVR